MSFRYNYGKKQLHGLYLIGVGVALIAFILLSGSAQPPGTTATSSTIATTTAPIATTTTLAAATTTAPPTTTTTAAATVTTSTTVAGNQPPAVISVSTKPDPIRTGKEVTFSANVADAEGEFVTVKICKDAQCNTRFCAGQGDAKPNGTAITCSYVIPVTVTGKTSYWAKAEEAGRSSPIAGPFSFNVTPL